MTQMTSVHSTSAIPMPDAEEVFSAAESDDYDVPDYDDAATTDHEVTADEREEEEEEEDAVRSGQEDDEEEEQVGSQQVLVDNSFEEIPAGDGEMTERMIEERNKMDHSTSNETDTPTIKRISSTGILAEARPPAQRVQLSQSDKIKAGLLLTLFVTAAIIALTVDSASESLRKSVQWFDKNQAASFFIIWTLYSSAVPTMVPIKTVLAIISGYVFGFPLGVFLVYTGACAGGFAAFFGGRYFCKDTVQRFLYSRSFMLSEKMDNKWYKRAREFEFLMQEYPFSMAFSLMLTPIPFEWLNYFLSNTSIKGIPYALSLFASRTLSKASIYVYLGSVLKDSSRIVNGKVNDNFWLMTGITIFFLLMSAVMAYFLHMRAKEWIIDEIKRRKAVERGILDETEEQGRVSKHMSIAEEQPNVHNAELN